MGKQKLQFCSLFDRVAFLFVDVTPCVSSSPFFLLVLDIGSGLMSRAAPNRTGAGSRNNRTASRASAAAAPEKSAKEKEAEAAAALYVGWGDASGSAGVFGLFAVNLPTD